MRHELNARRVADVDRDVGIAEAGNDDVGHALDELLRGTTQREGGADRLEGGDLARSPSLGGHRGVRGTERFL